MILPGKYRSSMMPENHNPEGCSMFRDKVSKKNKAELAEYYQNAFFKAVEGGHALVDRPDPGGMKVRAAITGETTK